MKRLLKILGITVLVIVAGSAVIFGVVYLNTTSERKIAEDFMLKLSSGSYEDVSAHWMAELKKEAPPDRFAQMFGYTQKYVDVEFVNLSTNTNGSATLSGTATTDFGCKSDIEFEFFQGEIFSFDVEPLCQQRLEGFTSIEAEREIVTSFLSTLSSGSYEETAKNWHPDLKAEASKDRFDGIFLAAEDFSEINLSGIQTFDDMTAKLTGYATTASSCLSRFSIAFSDEKMTSFSVDPVCRTPSTLSTSEVHDMVQNFLMALPSGSYEEATKDWHPTLKTGFGPSQFLRIYGGQDQYADPPDGSVTLLDGGVMQFTSQAVATSGCTSDISINVIQDQIINISLNPRCRVANTLSTFEISKMVRDTFFNLSTGSYEDVSKDWHPLLKEDAPPELIARDFANVAQYVKIDFETSSNEKGQGTRLTASATTESGCKSAVKVWILEDSIRSFSLTPICRTPLPE